MQFSSKEDIEAPIDDVFVMLSEFEAFERSAIRRGVEVHRKTESTTPRQGMEWDARFSIRGKQRDMKLVLARYDAPNGMQFDADSQGLDGIMVIDLVPLSQKRTRMSIVLNLKPKTLTARLFIQSMKLAKSNMTKRFKLKVADYAKAMEERHQRTA